MSLLVIGRCVRYVRRRTGSARGSGWVTSQGAARADREDNDGGSGTNSMARMQLLAFTKSSTRIKRDATVRIANSKSKIMKKQKGKTLCEVFVKDEVFVREKMSVAPGDGAHDLKNGAGCVAWVLTGFRDAVRLAAAWNACRNISDDELIKIAQHGGFAADQKPKAKQKDKRCKS